MKQGMGAGHYVPSSVGGFAIRYDEMNVHAQCMRCNVHLSGNPIEYRERMVKQYGEKEVKKLEARRHDIIKDFDYDAAIKKYKTLCDELGLNVH